VPGANGYRLAGSGLKVRYFARFIGELRVGCCARAYGKPVNVQPGFAAGQQRSGDVFAASSVGRKDDTFLRSASHLGIGVTGVL